MKNIFELWLTTLTFCVSSALLERGSVVYVLAKFSVNAIQCFWVTQVLSAGIEYVIWQRTFTHAFDYLIPGYLIIELIAVVIIVRQLKGSLTGKAWLSA